MEQASQHLVHRRYFEAEQLCIEALRRSHAIRDYDRLARLVLPLQEARRQKRDLALDAGDVFLVNGEMPDESRLRPGCYLVAPPRVGVDGRLLREAADRRHVPIVVTVREPTTREGLWPIVAVGPTTIRTKVPPPPPQPLPTVGKGGKVKARAGTKTRKAAAPVDPQPAAPASANVALPPPRWFAEANEALGDAAIANLNPSAHPTSRVDSLIELLEAHPDHEKLHQRLEEAARAAARDPRPPRRSNQALLDEWDEEADEADNGH